MKRVLTLVSVLTITVLMLPNLLFSQAQKRVLIEDFTSSTCGPCASFNPGFHSWIEAHRSTISIVSFHMNWPTPYNDPMYMANPSENAARQSYYNVNYIPQLWLEGVKLFDGANFSGITTWHSYYLAQTTPVGIGITDTRVAPDSIVTNVAVTNMTNLPVGVYTLKVYVVEHGIYFPPGTTGCTNGEQDFPDVFRKALTNISGTVISTNAGTYNYQFRYKRDPSWADAQIYTIALVQNEGTKASMNTISSNFPSPTGITPYSNVVPSNYVLSQNYPNPFNPTSNIKFSLPKTGEVSLKIYDILGNEVQNLVEGVQQAGEYNITVDGTNLASGIYFYTLRAGSFVETKKMSLIK